MQTTQNTKTIAAFEARRKFGKLLQRILKGDKFVVERNGEKVAAVVPIELFEQWKESRNAFFEKVRAVARQANLSDQEADKLADKSVRAVRQSPIS